MNLPESIKAFLPQYLSAESTDALFEGLESFIENGTTSVIYTTPPDGDITIYQGDAIVGLPYFNYKTGKVKAIPSIIISNTCDIALENSRKVSKNICYAPLVRLGAFYDALVKKFDKNSADSIVASIKQQKTHNILYLPAGSNLLEDHIAFLDKITNIDNRDISREDLKNSRLFTLSNTGFYLFLLKLSINFTRIQEKVDRSFIAASA